MPLRRSLVRYHIMAISVRKEKVDYDDDAIMNAGKEKKIGT